MLGSFRAKTQPRVQGVLRPPREGLAASLVLLFHSVVVPTHVAGEWLIETDGTSQDWYFAGSSFIAAVDNDFG
ncbi:hypothetical protein [Mesorhizobium mediterraneum]|uniref:hypothetical protein n=1 Tax=Mesorhizobium mediterraneum TaxID=43617 RepID=UPI001785C7DF|nr:hypothetical protein [Mesorhizobium mediterraneum]